eukprot:3406761-Alexandrium_andersonii.AAC.1
MLALHRASETSPDAGQVRARYQAVLRLGKTLSQSPDLIVPRRLHVRSQGRGFRLRWMHGTGSSVQCSEHDADTST